jgi:hypothetical protein
MKADNRFFENVAKFRYWGMIVSNQNFIHEEIMNRLNFGNACCCSVQNFLSSHLLPKSVKIKIYRTVILAVIFFGHTNSRMIS